MKTIRGVLLVVALATSAAAQSASGLIEVPMSLTKLRIYMQVTLNGKGPFNMLLDTGSSTSFLTKEVAKNLGLKMSQKATEVSGFYAAEGYTTKLESIRIGNLEAHDVEALVWDIKSAEGSPKTDGI